MRSQKIKSSEMVFIKKETNIFKYQHEGFDSLEDSNHLRKLLGV